MKKERRERPAQVICFRAENEARELELEDRNKSEDYLHGSQAGVVQQVSSEMLALETKGWNE